MFQKSKAFSSVKSLPDSFKKLEWQLAEELSKLEQRRTQRSDDEFQQRLNLLIDEYGVDRDTLLDALRTGNI